MDYLKLPADFLLKNKYAAYYEKKVHAYPLLSLFDLARKANIIPENADKDEFLRKYNLSADWDSTEEEEYFLLLNNISDKLTSSFQVYGDVINLMRHYISLLNLTVEFYSKITDTSIINDEVETEGTGFINLLYYNKGIIQSVFAGYFDTGMKLNFAHAWSVGGVDYMIFKAILALFKLAEVKNISYADGWRKVLVNKTYSDFLVFALAQNPAAASIILPELRFWARITSYSGDFYGDLWPLLDMLPTFPIVLPAPYKFLTNQFKEMEDFSSVFGNFCNNPNTLWKIGSSAIQTSTPDSREGFFRLHGSPSTTNEVQFNEIKNAFIKKFNEYFPPEESLDRRFFIFAPDDGASEYYGATFSVLSGINKGAPYRYTLNITRLLVDGGNIIDSASENVIIDCDSYLNILTKIKAQITYKGNFNRTMNTYTKEKTPLTHNENLHPTTLTTYSLVDNPPNNILLFLHNYVAN